MFSLGHKFNPNYQLVLEQYLKSSEFPFPKCKKTCNLYTGFVKLTATPR